ncbi:MAG: methionyl-tRNA formyltransferase [Thermoanaerobaculia bacterium]|nr:methionyl-tRNA formyltransferase [Thermoanaerobaculia bacterium]
MRIVFFGTPSFAIPTLDALAREHEIALIVAQPDRPAGRGMKMQKPAVVVRAEELELPFAQPQKIRTDEFLESIAALEPDVGIVIAYGRILPGRLLSIPKHGFLNVHGSLLPKYRGAAPIQRAIAAGETETGVTIMRVDEELDHGPMLAIDTADIGADERLPAISERLADLGADAMLRVLRNLARGATIDRHQDHARATHAPKIEKSEGLVTFEEPAAQTYNRFRAFDPWPGLFLESGGQTIKIPEMRTTSGSGAPRTILEVGDGVVVATGEGALRLIELQRAGKPRASAADVARGLGWHAGARIP